MINHEEKNKTKANNPRQPRFLVVLILMSTAILSHYLVSLSCLTFGQRSCRTFAGEPLSVPASACHKNEKKRENKFGTVGIPVNNFGS